MGLDRCKVGSLHCCEDGPERRRGGRAPPSARRARSDRVGSPLMRQRIVDCRRRPVLPGVLLLATAQRQIYLPTGGNGRVSLRSDIPSDWRQWAGVTAVRYTSRLAAMGGCHYGQIYLSTGRNGRIKFIPYQKCFIKKSTFALDRINCK